jgi:hypothetical protein
MREIKSFTLSKLFIFFLSFLVISSLALALAGKASAKNSLDTI